MILTQPMPYVEALQAAAIKTILPTTGQHRDLRQLEPALKRRALWMATNTIVPSLQRLGEGVQQILSGELSDREVRDQLAAVLEAEGYRPDPKKAGGIEDLGSTRRLKLAIDTQVELAHGAGWKNQGLQPDVLEAFPAQELVRFYGPSDPAQQRDWASRWARVGGQFFDGRMVALKTDDIWRRLGSSEFFDDALDTDHSPYAFNSGMGERDIDHAESVALGLIEADTVITPPADADDLVADLQGGPEIRDAWLRDALVDTGLGRFDAAGVFQFTGGGQ